MWSIKLKTVAHRLSHPVYLVQQDALLTLQGWQAMEAGLDSTMHVNCHQSSFEPIHVALVAMLL